MLIIPTTGALHKPLIIAQMESVYSSRIISRSTGREVAVSVVSEDLITAKSPNFRS
jgi:hypothetical protein